MFFSGCFQDFSLDVSSLIMMCLHTDFLGLSCLEFTELLESVGICLLSNLGKFFLWVFLFFGLLFILDNSYWFYWFDFKLSLSCVISILLSPILPNEFYISIIVFFRKVLKFPFILLYTSFLPICFSFLLQFSTHLFQECSLLLPPWKKMLNTCFKVFGNPTSGSSHH